MNGPQDLGGQMGFGPVAPEADEPVFHTEWEKRALGVNLCTIGMGHWPLDELRHSRESLSPADYYTSSYYEIWIKAVERLVVKHGFITAEELVDGNPRPGGTRPKRVLQAADISTLLASGSPSSRPLNTPPRFAEGQRVRTKVMHPTGHTRLPRYARGKNGTVTAAHGAHIFPDTNAHGAGENPQHLYTVCFDGRELWGEDADPTLSVSIDAWETYLEPA